MTSIDAAEPSMTRTMLTTKELAARWCVSAGSLANDRASGRSTVPYVKIGDRVRYRLSDVENFEERAVRGGGPDRRR